MYEVKSGLKKINDVVVETFVRKVSEPETSLNVEVGTTGYKGTPTRKSGGRTYIRLGCGTGDFCFEPVTDSLGTVTGIEIAACGDAGLDGLMKALKFASRVLDDQRRGIVG